MFKMRCILVKLLFLTCVWVRSFAFDVHYEQNGNARCLSMEYNFRFFTRILQKKCVKECATRPMCRAVNYHRSHQLCELLSQDVGNVSDFAPPCELIKKSDIEVTLPTECNQCTEGETCDINDLTGSGTCVIKECKPLKLTNGHILGNMKVIDSRIVYMCNEGYRRSTDVNFSVCLSNGSWSGDPDCIPDRPQLLDFCPGFVLDDGTTYLFGTLNSSSHFDSCNHSHIYCYGNGTWETILTCDRVFFSYVCSDMTALYLGCYLNCPWRLLQGEMFEMKGDFAPATTDKCIKLCSSKNYNYASTENGVQCFCGNEVLHFTRVDELECNKACKDNTSQICGGGWRSSLYDLTMYTGHNGTINNEEKCDRNGKCIPPC